MAKPVVLMDLDSVVVDMVPKWFTTFNAEYGEHLDPYNYDEWDLRKLVQGPCKSCIYDILDRDGFFRDMPFIDGAEEGMRELVKVSDLVIATSALDNPNAARDKMLWVRENLPFVKKGNIMIGIRKDLLHGDVMVDDSPGNLRKTLARHKVVLDYPYNRKVKDAERVYNWTELVAAVRRYVDAD